MAENSKQEPEAVAAFRQYCKENDLTYYKALGIETTASNSLRKVIAILKESFPSLAEKEIAELVREMVTISF